MEKRKILEAFLKYLDNKELVIAFGDLDGYCCESDEELINGFLDELLK